MKKKMQKKKTLPTKTNRHKSYPNILEFEQISIEDIEIVGGKNASLGEMFTALKKKKINVPDGFALTSFAYQYILGRKGALNKIKEILKGLNSNDTVALEKASRQAKETILCCDIPDDLKEEILAAYRRLSCKYKMDLADVAVRSSATAEDLPNASFAGQQETYLNIKGEEALLSAIKKCLASLFTARAIAYRCENKIDHLKVSLSVGVQKMVRSDISTSGVIFTLDTETGFANTVFLTASYGLGESIVQGSVDPDEFFVFKPTLKKGYRALFNKVLGSKASKIIYSHDLDEPTKKVDTTAKDRDTFCLQEEEVLKLSKWACEIEDHYSKKNGRWTPVDVEWAKDGQTNELFIVQARPETVQSRKDLHHIESYKLEKKGRVISHGKSVGTKICCGTARVIHDVKDMKEFKPGEILITDMTNPDWVPIMRIAAGIVTNRGGRTSHAAIVSRELGLPCIVGTSDATQAVKTGQKITIDCTQGENGLIYDGHLPFSLNKIDTRKLNEPKTPIMLNVGYPDDAFALSFLPSGGVGLAREEFIISEYIRIHPMALVHFDKVKDPVERKKIEEMTKGYQDKKEFFIDKLAMGVGIIAAAFYPRDVILRFSDFKTNEYSNLIGGASFEPKEENPMIGWRGASRYYKDGYKEGFALECKAIKKVRDEYGLVNLKVMIPVCRTPDEGKKVLEAMRKNGLTKGKNGLEVYVMCEIPSNVILAEEFCEIFDGFSIGSNDLTQMILGVDRDSELVSDIYDERNEAVKKMIQHVISIAKKKKKKIGICGEAPSNYPEFARFLVDCGISSISTSPSAFFKTRNVVAQHEHKKKKK